MLCDVFGVAARVEDDGGRLRLRIEGPADPTRRL
jgi:hypothetical protein